MNELELTKKALDAANTLIEELTSDLHVSPEHRQYYKALEELEEFQNRERESETSKSIYSESNL